MNNEKPAYCTQPEEDNCFWCELSADGVDCHNNSFDIDLAEILEEPDHPEYCTQNAGDCSTCSLVNYGLDCQNNRVSDRKTAD